MKPLVIFYSSCILVLYSVLTFIGYRKEKFGDIHAGLLPEVTITAPICKTSESKVLSQHFDNALVYLKEKQKKKAAIQVYDALNVVTARAISSGNYNEKDFWLIVKNLSHYYIALELKRPVSTSKMKETFESAELFVAEGFMLRSSTDLKKNNFSNAIENVNKAEECMILAGKYSKGTEVEIQRNLFNSSRNLIDNIIKGRKSTGASSTWKRIVHKMNNLEGTSV